MNPSLLRTVTPPDTSFDLHLPAGAAALFAQRIAQIPEAKRNAWRYHRVAPGDTLASVAREYRVTEEALAAANQRRLHSSVDGVEALVVPTPPQAAPSARAMIHTVRRGETLVTIADRFGVSLSELRRWNHISGIKVPAGRRLRVSDPENAPHHAAGGRRLRSAHARTNARKAAPGAGKRHISSTAKRRRAQRSGAVHREN